MGDVHLLRAVNCAPLRYRRCGRTRVCRQLLPDITCGRFPGGGGDDQGSRPLQREMELNTLKLFPEKKFPCSSLVSETEKIQQAVFVWVPERVLTSSKYNYKTRSQSFQILQQKSVSRCRVVFHPSLNNESRWFSRILVCSRAIPSFPRTIHPKEVM